MSAPPALGSHLFVEVKIAFARLRLLEADGQFVVAPAAAEPPFRHQSARAMKVGASIESSAGSS